MALWFLAAFAWGALQFWRDGEPAFFLLPAGVGCFAAAQLLGQHRLLAWTRRGDRPTWMKFSTAGALAAGTFHGLNLAIAIGLATRLGGTGFLSQDIREWFPLTSGGLVGWYFAWWIFLRVGWADVGTGLIASGIHGALLAVAARIQDHFGRETLNLIPLGIFNVEAAEVPWWWSAPVGFFAAWSLLFLPGALVAAECAPSRQGGQFALKRVIAWTAPLLASLLAALLASAGSVFLGIGIGLPALG